MPTKVFKMADIKLTEANRDIVPQQVERLKKSIKKYGYLEGMPIVVDEDGFIGVALGSYYGIIGDRFYVTLDSGVVLPLVKVEEKADGDTDGGCYHYSDGSVIEFVIDKNVAGDYFGIYGNGLVLSGNYNNYELFINKRLQMIEDELKKRLLLRPNFDRLDNPDSDYEIHFEG